MRFTAAEWTALFALLYNILMHVIERI